MMDTPQAAQLRDRRPLSPRHVAVLHEVIDGMTTTPPESVVDARTGWLQRIGFVRNVGTDADRWVRTRRYQPLDAAARAAGGAACIDIWRNAPSPHDRDAPQDQRDTGVSVSITEGPIQREAVIDVEWGATSYVERFEGEVIYEGTPGDAYNLVDQAFARHLGIALNDLATDRAI